MATGIIESAIWIPLMPILAFPVILFLGHMLNGLPQWKNGAKEGGIIALVVMFASLILSIWVIIEHLNHVGAASVFTWATSAWWDGQTSVMETRVFGVGIYIDHITVMLLFVASFLCFLINIFSIGYMNTCLLYTSDAADE